MSTHYTNASYLTRCVAFGLSSEVVEQHDYLGECLHHKLPWQPHIDFICNKANGLIGFLHRNHRHYPGKLKECAYKQMTLPIVATVCQFGTLTNINL